MAWDGGLRCHKACLPSGTSWASTRRCPFWGHLPRWLHRPPSFPMMDGAWKTPRPMLGTLSSMAFAPGQPRSGGQGLHARPGVRRSATRRETVGVSGAYQAALLFEAAVDC